jgi:hypothetical protein
MAALARRRCTPWPKGNEHWIGEVEVSSWVQAIEKLTKLRALPPTSRAWGVFDRRLAIRPQLLAGGAQPSFGRTGRLASSHIELQA